MNYIFFDLETDGNKIFDAAYCTLDDGPVTVKTESLVSKLLEADVIVGHNIKAWDIPILKKIFPKKFQGKPLRIWDTLEIEAVLQPLTGCLSLNAKHKAADDTILIKSLFFSQVKRLQGIVRKDVCRILKIAQEDLPSVSDVEISHFFDIRPQRSLNITINQNRRTLILAPRILWPFLTDIKGLTFHYSSILDDIIDIEYTPVRIPDIIPDFMSLFAERFVTACQENGLAPMVFLTPEFFRNKLRYQTSQYSHLLDLGFEKTNSERNQLCVDPSDLTPAMESYYEDILVIEPEYASLCSEQIKQNQDAFENDIPIRRIGNIYDKDGVRIRKRDFGLYAIIEKAYSLKRSPDAIFRFPSTQEIVTETNEAQNHWKEIACVISKQKEPLVIAVVHHESDIPFLSGYLNNNTSINFPQQYISQRKGFHKYIDLATRGKSKTGIVIATAGMIASASFQCQHQTSIILCDDDIFGLHRHNDGKLVNKDAIDRVTTAIIRAVFPNCRILRTSPSQEKDFVIDEPKADKESIKAAIRNELIHGNSFRSGQEPCIDAILQGGNHFICLPTGTGKSVLFQGPAFFATNRLSIVFSPLKALIDDQVSELEFNEESVDYLHGGHHPQSSYDKIRDGKTRLLYITPEQFAKKNLTDALKYRRDRDGGLGYIIFDEAHCISVWGFDFRPSYLHAAYDCTKMFPSEKYLFLSATLPACVKNDIAGIMSQININDILKDTRNILNEKIIPHAEFIEKDDVPENVPQKGERTSWMHYVSHFEKAAELIRESKLDLSKSCVVIFFDDQDGCKELAEKLQDEFPAYADRIRYYHSDIKDDLKKEMQTLIKNNGISIVVCTKALGMGVNIKNIHLVIHIKRPDSIEDYLQEIGRAGRDEDLMKELNISQINAYCLDLDEKASPNDITSWDTVCSFFENLCRMNPEIGQEFKVRFRKNYKYARTPVPNYEAVFFYLKELDRIQASELPESLLVRVRNLKYQVSHELEMDSAARALLQYLIRQNQKRQYNINIMEALDFVRGSLINDGDYLKSLKIKDLLINLEKRGYILILNNNMFRINRENNRAKRYWEDENVQWLYDWILKKKPKICSYEQKSEIRNIKTDATEISKFLSNYPDSNIECIMENFVSLWAKIKKRCKGPEDNAEKFIPFSEDISSISEKELMERHILPRRILEELHFVTKLTFYKNYSVTMKDSTPVGEKEGDDNIRLRLEAHNRFKSLKQLLCQCMMENLYKDESFDFSGYISRYFHTVPPLGEDVDTLMAPFSALLDILQKNEHPQSD